MNNKITENYENNYIDKCNNDNNNNDDDNNENNSNNNNNNDNDNIVEKWIGV